MTPDPHDYVEAMLLAAREAGGDVTKMPGVGKFALDYGQQISEEITPETVEAFMHGAAVANVLVQEAILAVVLAATQASNDAHNDGEDAIAQSAASIREGATMIAGLLADTADAVIEHLVGSAVIDREFNGIVANF